MLNITRNELTVSREFAKLIATALQLDINTFKVKEVGQNMLNIVFFTEDVPKRSVVEPLFRDNPNEKVTWEYEEETGYGYYTITNNNGVPQVREELY